MTHEAVSFEKVFHRAEFLAFESLAFLASFTEMFHESLKKQFSWNLILRHTVELTAAFPTLRL